MKDDQERFQLRLSLLSFHRNVVFLGSQWNFGILLVLLILTTGAGIYFFSSTPFLTTFIFTIPAFALHKSYFIDLPKTKSILAFFEQNHPELCSWLEESAFLEAKMLCEKKEA